MLRRAAALLLAVALTAAPAPTSASPEADAKAVIEKQLDAFQRDAWGEAFGYASPGIQRLFGNPQAFSEMVRGGYPMVWRPADVRFLGVEREGTDLIHRLRLRDQKGVAYVARYRMRQVAGEWRIAGVSIEKADDLAT